MGDFKEHGLMLYLGPDLYLGFIRFQAEMKLGRSYAGLYIFNEGARLLDLISPEVYEANKQKYSRALDEQQAKPLTMEQLNAKKELDQWTFWFKGALIEWAIHPDPKWRQVWFNNAERWKDKIPAAKLVLALKNGDQS